MAYIEGDQHNNTLHGTRYGDTIDGHEGDDTLYGLGGHDLLFGGSGADKLYGGEGDDVLVGGSGIDQLFGGAGYDVAVIDRTGSSVDYSLVLKAGGALSVSNDGEQLKGVEAIEFYGGSGAENVTASAGDDLISGGGGNDRLDGGAGADGLEGGSGADRLMGGIGSDTLGGGSGDDVLIGGAGGDLLIGDSGADRFVFNTGDSRYDANATHWSLGGKMDFIDDFFHSEGDKIDLRGVDADSTTAGDQAFHVVGSFHGHAGELVIRHGRDFDTVLADTNGDGHADFGIGVYGPQFLQAGDLML